MPEPAIALTTDRDDPPEHAAALNGLRSDRGPCLLVEPVAEVRTIRRLAHCVLRGLGKRPDSSGTSRENREAWRRAQSWSAGEDLQLIVVSRAHLLVASHWSSLSELAETCGAYLWFVIQGTEPNRSQKHWLRQRSVERAPFAQLREHIDPLLSDVAEVPRGARPFPTVPGHDFPAFLAAACERLAPDDARSMERTYWRAFEYTKTWAHDQPAIDHDSMYRLLCDPTLASPDLNKMITRLRAVQAALFHEGWLLGVSVRDLAAGYASLPTAGVTGDAVSRLRQLEDPQRAGSALISLSSQQSPPVLAQMDLADISADGRSCVVDGHPHRIPDYAAGICRALRVYRQLQGAAEQDPLFVSEQRNSPGRALGRTTAHGLQAKLRRTGEDTGLLLTSRDAWAEQQPHRWLKRRGLELRRLT